MREMDGMIFPKGSCPHSRIPGAGSRAHKSLVTLGLAITLGDLSKLTLPQLSTPGPEARRAHPAFPGLPPPCGVPVVPKGVSGAVTW